MLSQHNIDRIVLTGLYSHKPEEAWVGGLLKDDLYWNMNWTFKVSKVDDTYFMSDTLFGTRVMLTDENFDEFEFIFDFEEVRMVTEECAKDFADKDSFYVRCNSSKKPVWFVQKGAQRDLNLVVLRIQQEISDLQYRIVSKKADLSRIMRRIQEEENDNSN